jgi:hypothetical protein
MVKLGDAAPALWALQRRQSTPAVYSDDIPADYLRFMLGLPDDASVISRVDQLWQSNGHLPKGDADTK